MIEIIGTELYQWDTGRSVAVTNIDAKYVHFANPGDSKAVIIEIENGSAKIPDYLLQTGKTVVAYAVANGVTIGIKLFSVRERERPENYIYEEDQRNYIYALVQSAEGATAEAMRVAEDLKTARDNGEFDGYTPVRGVDYWTEADKEEIKDYVDEAIGSGASGIVNEASGNPIVIKDADGSALKGLTLYGKNLLSLNDITFNGVYSFELEKPIPAGKYKFYVGGITSTNTKENFRIGFYSNGSEIQALQVEKIAGETNLSVESPVDKIYLYNGTSYSDAQGHDGTWKDMMISVDGGAYAPYFGGGDVEVKVMGKNLIDYRKAYARDAEGQTVTIDESINGLYWTGNYYLIIPVSLPAGITVTFSSIIESLDANYAGGLGYVSFKYTDGTVEYQGDGDGKTLTKDLESIYVYKQKPEATYSAVVRNIQLEIGTKITEYEPYKEEQTIVVSVPNGLGGDGFVCDNCAQLHTYKPNTTITNDVGALMEVEYVADTKAYIDNKFNELAATLTALTGV